MRNCSERLDLEIGVIGWSEELEGGIGGGDLSEKWYTHAYMRLLSTN